MSRILYMPSFARGFAEVDGRVLESAINHFTRAIWVVSQSPSGTCVEEVRLDTCVVSEEVDWLDACELRDEGMVTDSAEWTKPKMFDVCAAR